MIINMRTLCILAAAVIVLVPLALPANDDGARQQDEQQTRPQSQEKPDICAGIERINALFTLPTPTKKQVPACSKSVIDPGIPRAPLVIARARINEKGEVEAVDALRSTHPECTQAALNALRNWKFKPALKEHHPVTVCFTITMNPEVR